MWKDVSDKNGKNHHRHLIVATNIFCLQYPSPTSDQFFKNSFKGNGSVVVYISQQQFVLDWVQYFNWSENQTRTKVKTAMQKKENYFWLLKYLHSLDEQQLVVFLLFCTFILENYFPQVLLFRYLTFIDLRWSTMTSSDLLSCSKFNLLQNDSNICFVYGKN